jgi:hypothetical protein
VDGQWYLKEQAACEVGAGFKAGLVVGGWVLFLADMHFLYLMRQR